MDNYKHNWYVHDSMYFAREMWFADMKAKPDKQQIAAYVNTGEIPFMYLQEGKHCVAMRRVVAQPLKHQARVNSNYTKNNLPSI